MPRAKLSTGGQLSVGFALGLAGDSSVVVVDWGKLAASWPFLEQAAFNVVPVAAQVAKLIKRLREYHQVCIREFYPIGLGIGAHLAGHISIALNRRLARVTGLDPLGSKGTV